MGYHRQKKTISQGQCGYVEHVTKAPVLVCFGICSLALISLGAQLISVFHFFLLVLLTLCIPCCDYSWYPVAVGP